MIYTEKKGTWNENEHSSYENYHHMAKWMIGDFYTQIAELEERILDDFDFGLYSKFEMKEIREMFGQKKIDDDEALAEILSGYTTEISRLDMIIDDDDYVYFGSTE